MNRTAATCTAGIKSKAPSTMGIHLFQRPREATPFARTRRFFALGFAISAKRLRWRPERNHALKRSGDLLGGLRLIHFVS